MSALARQLRQIQQSDRQAGGHLFSASFRSSFLFDEKEAADYDADTIYEIGISGLLGLIQHDLGFRRFETSLFSSKSKDLDRSLLTVQENELIDRDINTFLRMLGPHFLINAAHKALEWLVRKYRINELDVPEVVECILPYHDSIPFVRMVQILYFKDNDKWSFLFDVKKEAKFVNRSFIAQRCLVDRTILDSIFENALSSPQNPMLTSFFTLLTIEYIGKIKKMDFNHVNHLFTMIISCLKLDQCKDLLVAGMMITMQLVEKANLSEGAFDEILEISAKAANKTGGTKEFLAFLVRLIENGHVTNIPDRALNHILHLPYTTCRILMLISY